MTATELKTYLNHLFGISNSWPKIFEVDAITYANCVQAVFDTYSEELRDLNVPAPFVLAIRVGKNGGLIFKNVELILQGYEK